MAVGGVGEPQCSRCQWYPVGLTAIPGTTGARYQRCPTSSTPSLAALQPGVPGYFIWGPQILLPKMSPFFIFQPYGTELSPRLGSVPWPHRYHSPQLCTKQELQEESGWKGSWPPGMPRASAGPTRALLPTAVPTARRKSPCCPPAGTYVCSEAPAPKLLLLICNPLRAGGKGIRGISGLIVTTTIISSGGLGQAARTHAPTGLHTDTDTRTPTPTHTHTHTCAHTHKHPCNTAQDHQGWRRPPRSSKHEYNGSRLGLAGACTALCRHNPAHPHGYRG